MRGWRLGEVFPMATISLASKWAEEREGRESENCWRYLWTLLEREGR